ncbi:MAG: lysophospholipase [Actinobacteria bacterium]|nr:lysophospholipase [Actinomycetota bacterium]
MTERHFRLWEAPDPRGVVALVHGVAEHSGRYAHVAERLSGAGYSVVTVDLLGHGRSAGWPGGVSSLDEWIADVDALLDRAGEEADGLPVFLMGHSLGALLAATHAIRNPGLVAGLVLSGTAVLAGDAYIEAAGRGEGVPAEAISRDPDVVLAYVEDPLCFHDRVTPEANALGLEAAIETNARASEITLPVLMVHGGSDMIADVEGVRDLLASLGSEDKTLQVYEGLYHEVMNEPERERVIDDVVAWLDGHVPA